MVSIQEQLNFCFPLRVLANDRVKVVPFEAEKHAQRAFDLVGPHKQMYAYTTSGPYDSKEHFVKEFLQETSYADKAMATFAIIDKTKPSSAEDPEGELAGTMSYMFASVPRLSVEIGYVYIYPPYQRSHVASNGVGLLAKYALASPEEGGLGLARLEWRAHALNQGSIKLAERMGFEKEGITKWHVCFKEGKLKGKMGNGAESLPPCSGPDDLWRDTITLSHCWDKWRQGGEEMVNQAMNRTK